MWFYPSLFLKMSSKRLRLKWRIYYSKIYRKHASAILNLTAPSHRAWRRIYQHMRCTARLLTAVLISDHNKNHELKYAVQDLCRIELKRHCTGASWMAWRHIASSGTTEQHVVECYRQPSPLYRGTRGVCLFEYPLLHLVCLTGRARTLR